MMDVKKRKLIESLGSVLHGANGEATIRNRDDRVRTDQVREAKSLVFRDKIWSTDWRETLKQMRRTGLEEEAQSEEGRA